MGFSYTGAATTSAHQHSAAASDGGVLSGNVTIIDTPTLEVYVNTRAIALG